MATEMPSGIGEATIGHSVNMMVEAALGKGRTMIGTARLIEVAVMETEAEIGSNRSS